MDENSSDIRIRKLSDYIKSIGNDYRKLDYLDFENQVFYPELCVNIKYSADESNMAHSMQVLKDGSACYVAFDRRRLPYGLRWYCKSSEENGLGFCLPTTGSNESTGKNREKGLFNTIKAYEEDNLYFKFGYISKSEADCIAYKINKILKGE